MKTKPMPKFDAQKLLEALTADSVIQNAPFKFQHVRPLAVVNVGTGNSNAPAKMSMRELVVEGRRYIVQVVLITTEDTMQPEETTP